MRRENEFQIYQPPASDEQIVASLQRALETDLRMRATGLRVEVQDGVVRFIGAMTDAVRNAARDIARRMRGILGFADDIEVLAYAATRDDDEILADLNTRLQATPALSRVQAQVERGVARLLGNVPTNADKAEAETMTCATPGVVDADNTLSADTALALDDEVLAVVSTNHVKDLADLLGQRRNFSEVIPK